MTHAELLAFIETRMKMSDHYQPTIIRELLTRGGEAPRDELAISVWSADQENLESARRTLMRWPRQTLGRHGVVTYDLSTKIFRLNVEGLSRAERDTLLAACDQKLRAWRRSPSRVGSSLRYRLLERANGRRQACGADASRVALDVDHIVPVSRSSQGHVRTASGERIPLNAEQNLQVLCASCNHGKRDAASYDFRPSLERLAETIRFVHSQAAALGYSLNDLESAVTGHKDPI